MNGYTFLIALGFVFCSLVIVITVFLHCRKIEKKCNHYIAKCIREQDCLTRQLERTRTEKEMMEKVIKTELAKAVKTSVIEKNAEDLMTSNKKQVSRIEITYFV